MATELDKLTAFFKSYSTTEDQLDFKMADENLGQKIPAISTGSIALDDALGCGGLPEGRIIQFYGKPSSGKSMMAYLSMKEAQKQSRTAKQLFIDAEQTFNAEWATILGLDTSRVVVVDGDTAVNGRLCFEMLLGIPKEDAKHILKGKSKQGFLDLCASGELDFNMIVLDSLGAIIPPIEDVAAVGKHNMSPLARFLSTTFKKLSLEVSKTKLPFVVINHIRSSLDAYGPDHTFAGGNSYSHFLSANIYFQQVNRADAKILDEKENKVGSTISATIEKSKFGAFPRKCEYRVDFSSGIIDQQLEIAQLALDYNIVLKPTSVSHEFGDRKWVGFGKFCDAIKDDPILAQELIQKVDETRLAKWEKLRNEQVEKRIASNLILDQQEPVSEEQETKKKKKEKNV